VVKKEEEKKTSFFFCFFIKEKQREEESIRKNKKIKKINVIKERNKQHKPRRWGPFLLFFFISM
jgi:hypothetical protein